MHPIRCLVLDHDDTCVNSSGTVGYPHFCQALAHFRPGLTISEHQFRRYCFDPGFHNLYQSVFGFTREELEQETAMWKEYVHSHYPVFFPGIPELMQRFRANGGIICIVSHSSADVVLAAYKDAGVPFPDLVLGSEQPPERRKPNPWPIQYITERFQLTADQVLVVDDLPPGCSMAHAARTMFAAAAWGGMLAETATYMRKYSDYFFDTVQDFSNFLFESR